MKKIAIVLTSFMLLFTLCACGGSGDDKTDEKKIEINENGIYAKPSNPTNYIAKTYNKLTSAINDSPDSSEKISKLIAQNFCADFFTLKNKKSADDVGGLTYIVASDQAHFKEYAINFVYANYTIIKNDEGSDELPQVKSVKVTKVSSDVITYPVTIPADPNLGTVETTEDEEFDAYVIDVKIEYESTSVSSDDLKTSATLYVINIDNRLSICEIE